MRKRKKKKKKKIYMPMVAVGIGGPCHMPRVALGVCVTP
jgi:hypothetical protein